MKKKFFITMSAIIALFFVGIIAESQAWELGAVTTYSNGAWQSAFSNSTSISAGTQVTVSVHSDATAWPYSPCGGRAACTYNGTGCTQVVSCPDDVNNCCKRITYTIGTAGTYQVKAMQDPQSYQLCPQTKGILRSGTYDCPAQ